MKKLTKRQIEFYQDNTSMKACAGIRLTEEELNTFIKSEIAENDFVTLTTQLQRINGACRYYFSPREEGYKELVYDVFQILTDVAKKYLGGE